MDHAAPLMRDCFISKSFFRFPCTGKGSINGQAEKVWHTWKEKQDGDKQLLRQMGNDQIPLEERNFGEGHYLRPSAIELINCKNVLLENFSIKSNGTAF